MALRSAQEQNHLLVAIHSLQRRGDWHRTLDRPADGVFEAKDLRVRLELAGKGVSVRKVSDGRFSLRAGKHEMIIYPADSTFARQAIAWRHQAQSDQAAVEGVCYSGSPQQFDFSKPMAMQLGFGIELRENENETGGASKTGLPELLSRPGKVVARWNALPAGQSSSKPLTIAVPNGQP